MQKKIEKRFLSELPMKIHSGKQCINYEKLIGKKINVLFGDLQAELEITNREGIYLYIKYKDYKPYPISIGHFKKCQFGALLKIKTAEFKLKKGDIIKDERRDLKIIGIKYEKYETDGREQNLKYYRYECKKCGYKKWIVEGALLNLKQDCAHCRGRDAMPGVDDIATTDPWMIKYFQEKDLWMTKKYSHGSGQEFIPKCPDCGELKDKPIRIADIYKNHSMGCKKCGDGISYPEKFMRQFLEQVLNDKLIHQLSKFHYIWIKEYRYDFYFILNNIQYIIETDGAFHNKDNDMSGRTEEESKAIDDLKDALATEHNIKVIRIDCKESTLDYIKERILKSELNDLFDLSNIDWEKCEASALSNLVKKTCEYKKNNSELTTLEIAERMQLSQNTITKYLKKGNILGWCEYDPKQERIEAQKRGVKKRQRTIEVFKNGELFKRFDGITELITKSEELFKIKLTRKIIDNRCNGKTKDSAYKGLTFKYIE